ncbi:MAG: sulfite exporter TauE/SafE family protein, partial [Paracoccaceae bacterium]
MPINVFDLTTVEIIMIFAAYLFAATAKGVTGLGFSTTCLPILVFAIGLKDALPLVLIPSICSNLVVMRQVGQFKSTILRFWPMLLATIPGLILGLWVLSEIDGDRAKVVFGLVLLMWCGFSFLKPDLRLPGGLEERLAPVSGICTGFLNGLTGS